MQIKFAEKGLRKKQLGTDAIATKYHPGSNTLKLISPQYNWNEDTARF